MRERTTVSELVSPERLAEIDEWIAKFPQEQRQSAVLQALRIVQDEQGWLSESAIAAVAEYLNMPEIAAFEVATFYSMYHLEPVGKHVIEICNNISCMLCGSNELLSHAKTTLNIDVGETTKDGQFTLKTAECLGACVKAPVCMIGRKYHENVSNEKFDEIVEQLRGNNG